jgi:hypothetical protein
MRTEPVPRRVMASGDEVSKQEGGVNDCSGLTLADVTEPDVLQGASSLAVNSLKGISADDDVGKSSSILENEDSR